MREKKREQIAAIKERKKPHRTAEKVQFCCTEKKRGRIWLVELKQRQRGGKIGATPLSGGKSSSIAGGVSSRLGNEKSFYEVTSKALTGKKRSS